MPQCIPKTRDIAPPFGHESRPLSPYLFDLDTGEQPVRQAVEWSLPRSGRAPAFFRRERDCFAKREDGKNWRRDSLKFA